MTTLWQATNYTIPVPYIVNTFIREYDLSKANISSLLYAGKISKSEYEDFLMMDKKLREVRVGLMVKKDRNVYTFIKSGITEAKKRLCMSNNIEDFDVVSVKNDAMFIMSKELQTTEFSPFKFNMKNVYTIFLKLQDLEIYYGDKLENGEISTNIDVKGINDSKVLLHETGMLDLICETCYMLQRDTADNTMRWLSAMYQKYVTRQLPIQYYRNFDNRSTYWIHSMTQTFELTEIDEEMLNAIDINRNLLILRDLMAIVSDIYRKSIRTH